MRVVVLGGGSSGEHFVGALRRLDDDCEITLVENRLVGGECSYWACMPTKTMLRAVDVVDETRRTPGIAESHADPLGVYAWRDVVAERNDQSQVEWLAAQRAELVRGTGIVTAPGRLSVNGTELEYDRLVLATGSRPAIPSIPGLEDVEYWTNHDATETTEVPESLVVLGAGPVGCELAQFFVRIGSRVTLVGSEQRLLGRVDAEAAALIDATFRDQGIELRLGAVTQAVEAPARLRFADGSSTDAARLLVATGRRVDVGGLGLEQLGVEAGPRGVQVDERLRAAENVWAIGDVTGVAQFTHVGKYQARIAAADIAGRETKADYRAIPASIFTDPEVATVGTTSGDGLVSGRWELTSTSRTSTYERPKREGFVKLVADPSRRVLVGAVAVGPEAGEWLQQLTLAIRGEVPLEVLLDTIQPYPTFSEAIFLAARELADEL